MRVAIIGLGVQGRKRRAVAGETRMAVVDPVASDVDFQRIEQVPIGSYDAACVCVPDQEKFAILRTFWPMGNMRWSKNRCSHR